MRTVLVLLLAACTAAGAQETPEAETAGAQAHAAPAASPCEAPSYREFDFWVGDWEVMSNGQAAGTNSIHPIHGGCALQENWQGAGAGGISGSSYNMYDRASGQWHQTWVDASGTLLLLDGGLSEGAMVLSGLRPTQDGGTALHRVTWTPNPDGTVRQLWEATTDEGASWTTLFDGLYTRVAATP